MTRIRIVALTLMMALGGCATEPEINLVNTTTDAVRTALIACGAPTIRDEAILAPCMNARGFTIDDTTRSVTYVAPPEVEQPAPPPAPKAAPEPPAPLSYINTTEREVAAAHRTCGYPYAPTLTVATCMQNMGFRQDGRIVSRATPERIAAERQLEAARAAQSQAFSDSLKMMMIMPPPPQRIVIDRGFDCYTLGSRLTGIITCD